MGIYEVLTMLQGIIKGILEQGFIYGILALGIYITYQILDYPDLSVDGTFPLGAAITAVLIIQGVNPWLAILLSFLGGALAGLATGIFHVVFHIKDLLSGILTMTALYSINLHISGKRASLPIMKGDTIFNSGISKQFTEWFDKYDNLAIIILCTLLIKFLLDWYLKTKSGLLLRAAGDNPVMVTTIAKNNGFVKIIGLMLCNGLAATAGSILCQQQKNFDSTMGQGMMVMGLASVIIGITILGRVPFIKATSMVIIGSILYKACLSIAINVGVDPINLKLMMTIIFLIALTSNHALQKRRFQKNA